MLATLTMVFGTVGRASAWRTVQDVEHVPPLGMRAVIHLNAVDPDTGETLALGEPIVGQIRHVNVLPDGRVDTIVYAGEQEPAEAIAAQPGKWAAMSPAEAEDALTRCEPGASMAAVHDLMLGVGDPDSPQFTVWRVLLEPQHPYLPVFGWRLNLNPVGGGAQPDLVPEAGEYIEVPTPESGLVAVTVFAAIPTPGIGTVVLWTPSLGRISEVDLVAAGWRQMDRDFGLYDPAFRFARRRDLAEQVQFTFEEVDGDWTVTDIALMDPSVASEDDEDLLPGALNAQVSAARDLARLDDVVAQWAKGL